MKRDEREERLRSAWRARAGEVWRQTRGLIRQRTAMECAAFILFNEGETELSDWLLCAAPRHARAVATGVAVHALRRGCTAAWDVLAAVDAMDFHQADEWFLDEADFAWSPEPGQLVPQPEKIDG
jgi:hypothetical protein